MSDIKHTIIELNTLIDKEHEYLLQEIWEYINKGGFCKLKEKCDKGLCDCTNEEYNSMCEGNTKLMVKIYDLEERIDKAIEYIECALSEDYDKETPSKYNDWRLDLLEMLKGDNNENN